MSTGLAVPGTVVPASSGVSPGGAQGLTGPQQVSADAGNIAVLGSDGLISVPQQTIWYQRLRSFNAIGNPTFEVDQRNVGAVVTNPANGIFIQDRWSIQKAASITATLNYQQTPAKIVLPGSNFQISQDYLYLVLTAQQTGTLPAGAFYCVSQFVEGPNLRELINDVHSLTVLLTSSVAPVKLGLSLSNTAGTYTLTLLATISFANTWTLIPFPNIPIWASAGNWNLKSGNNGYILSVTLGAGSTFTASANNAWLSGNFVGALGQDNWLANPNGTSLGIGFVQHEPGPASTPIDKPFAQNYDECLRYFCKSYPFGIKAGTVGGAGAITFAVNNSATTWPSSGTRFPKAMAKTPTVVVYSPATGNPNSSAGIAPTGELGTTAVNHLSDGGFNGPSYSSGLTAGSLVYYHYTADTGW